MVTDDNIAQLRKAAEESWKMKMTGATEEEKENEEEVEQMDDANVQVTNKDRDKAGGPSAGEGSGPPA